MMITKKSEKLKRDEESVKIANISMDKVYDMNISSVVLQGQTRTWWMSRHDQGLAL